MKQFDTHFFTNLAEPVGRFQTLIYVAKKQVNTTSCRRRNEAKTENCLPFREPFENTGFLEDLFRQTIAFLLLEITDWE
jgi:hypothetical protein